MTDHSEDSSLDESKYCQICSEKYDRTRKIVILSTKYKNACCHSCCYSCFSEIKKRCDSDIEFKCPYCRKEYLFAHKLQKTSIIDDAYINNTIYNNNYNIYNNYNNYNNYLISY